MPWKLSYTTITSRSTPSRAKGSVASTHNWRSILDNYPGRPNIIDHSFKLGGGELGVAELIAEYDGERVYACQAVELEDGKVKRVRAYFGGPFEAPQWRAQWVERM